MSSSLVSKSAGTSAGYLSALRRRWWIPVLCALVAGVGAYAVARTQKRAYDANAILKVNPQNLQDDITGTPSSIQKPIENALVEVPPDIEQYRTAERAVEFLQLKPFMNPVQVLSSTKAEVNKENGLIYVSARAEKPADAAAIANAMARGYVDLRQHRDLDLVRKGRQALERVARRRARIARRDPTVASDLSSATDRIQQLRLMEAIKPQSVVLVRAAGGAELSGTAPSLIGIFGALLGLMVGLALIAVREQTDRRIRTAGELEAVFDAPVLARVPRRWALEERRPLAELNPREIEPFRLLLARLRHAPEPGAKGSVAITSAVKDEGKTTTAWYLAAAATASGTKTLLLLADHAGSTIFDGDEAANGHGLTDAMSRPSEVADVAVGVDVGGARLDVVPAGSANGNGHLTGADAVARLLRSAEQAYELVIVETPPLPLAADAVPFVRGAGGVLIVCRNGAVDRDRAATLRQVVEDLRTPLLGLVAVGFGKGDRYP